MTVIIREPQASDSEAIHQVSRHLGYTELSPSEAYENLHALLNSPQDKLYVAQRNGLIVGWIHVFYARRLASAGFYEIGGLIVSPDAQGQGIGRKLVNHVRTQHRGTVRVRCNMLRKDAHRFYESIGFNNNKGQFVFQADAIRE
ncbi:GNAT family N-acetyltransferase [Pseudoalteromonas sp. R3]|uniref:GNAT family N-acetyltransferase n=1 Tax=Pseudoalteromonas sp. R3 TaxID=1709477 RepID=UPI0006B695E4|nr:GNAT family N-acetyltransferase [Pseudoalteromonas sp. R3]AZZ97835.1 N-acetyltransferase [Pseudoalteromonas sp. R3]